MPRRPWTDRVEDRVLVLALRGRDALILEQSLQRQGHASTTCEHTRDLAEKLATGAGTAILTEESLLGADLAGLDGWLADQPAWSDFPFILLATKRTGRRPAEAQAILERLGNVVVLERPIHADTLASAVTSALRVRRRQYEARRRLVELQNAEERLTQLNTTLESRIADRTEELSRTNDQLMQEVAERNRAEAALVQSQKMEAMGQLTGGIAHDFNNLLTIISGNLELIAHRAPDDRIQRLAGFATQATERAAKLTHQLLAFSRTQQLTLAPLSINRMVEGMNDLLERTIGPRIAKSSALDPCAPWVIADANQLELAVLNLAINARDAMADGGSLRIETSVSHSPPAGLSEGRYGVISVSDTGEGIPAHIIDRVFDPFFTTKPVGKGTGLGLSQVFGIARQSGGTARVTSQPGAGTTVSIWLPLTIPPVEVGSDARDDQARRMRSHEHVLVIDDDEGVRRFIVEGLELLGYVVSEASDGRAGLESMRQAAPDLLLVDYAMAGMTGIDVVKAAHALRPRLPAILVTGYAETDEIGESDGIERVIRKPFRIDDLADAMRSVLDAQDPA
jgi:signal transduction histidine kinase/ActR/RegA family two-component response regulator